jgi:hypothetical protein
VQSPGINSSTRAVAIQKNDAPARFYRQIATNQAPKQKKFAICDGRHNNQPRFWQYTPQSVKITLRFRMQRCLH